MKINRWLVVLGAVFVQVNLGAVYAWSLFNQPLVDTFGWAREDVVVTFSITIAVSALMTIFAGRLQDKIGPRWVATAGGVLLGIGLLLSSQATTLTEIYIYYGIIGGSGIGMTYVCPLSACVKWFPDKRGLISGIAVAGFGLGGFIFQPIIRFLIQNFGVSNTYFYLGIIYFVFVVAGAQLLRNPPAELEVASSSPTRRNEATQFSPTEMLKTYPFYLLWFMFLFGSMSGLMVISFAVDIGVDVFHLDSERAANAILVIALFNAAGRIVWGRISDRIGRLNTLMCVYGLTAITLLYMSLGIMNYPMFLATTSIMGFCFGGYLALYPSVTADYYGTKNLGINYGLMYQGYGISAFVGAFLVNLLPFQIAFIVAAVCCIAAIIMAKIIVHPVKMEKTTVLRKELVQD
ncbi:OFA family oxalate/formate antiporter-like MFS transporter [Natronobacillus azotifigens]|uniref:OFA family MFS transporter n=1 Tax=Natronobacillus azotifigens TaxID=472978 RepID=A0A9J6R9P2_9BACI|nr:OFA family MFS transporter [Natronobacillus azotifigens]MCZ0702078.1 OFA family MFS transporter [Natronobacillus azotifigens]